MVNEWIPGTEAIFKPQVIFLVQNMQFRHSMHICCHVQRNLKKCHEFLYELCYILSNSRLHTTDVHVDVVIQQKVYIHIMHMHVAWLQVDCMYMSSIYLHIYMYMYVLHVQCTCD